MNHPRELVTAADIQAMSGASKTHDLNPNAVRSAKFLGAAAGLKNLGFDLMTVLPGREASEYHRHLYEEECYYILSGSGEVVIDEHAYPVGPGDFLGFPANGRAHRKIAATPPWSSWPPAICWNKMCAITRARTRGCI